MTQFSKFWKQLLGGKEKTSLTENSGRTSNTLQPVKNEFDSVKIGNQIWMTRNLWFEKFRNGDLIPEDFEATELIESRYEGKPAMCNYENIQYNGAVYGKLYNWKAVIDPRGLAPEGWHVPTIDDWIALLTFLGGKRADTAKMKIIGNYEWNWRSEAPTNSSGFSALPGGYRSPPRKFFGIGGLEDRTTEKFSGIGLEGMWWSSSKDVSGEYPIYFYLSSGDDVKIEPLPSFHGYGLSVRCLKD